MPETKQLFVVIVGLVDKKQKYERKAIYNSNSVKYVENISPYLSEGSDVIVYKENHYFRFPKLNLGVCLGIMGTDINSGRISGCY